MKAIWAGFDKLEAEGGVTRQVLLLGFRSGFQVWDVEDSHNVHDLVSRHDGPVSFMQMLPNPIASKRSTDKFANSRPLLTVCADGFFAGGSNVQDGLATPRNRSTSNFREQLNGNYLPTTVQFYSMRSQSYVHALKFRSVVYSVRCSSRIVAVSQSTQVQFVTCISRNFECFSLGILMGFCSADTLFRCSNIRKRVYYTNQSYSCKLSWFWRCRLWTPCSGFKMAGIQRKSNCNI